MCQTGQKLLIKYNNCTVTPPHSALCSRKMSKNSIFSQALKILCKCPLFIMNKINKLETDSVILLCVFHCQCTKRFVDIIDIFSTLNEISWSVGFFFLCVLVCGWLVALLACWLASGVLLIHLIILYTETTETCDDQSRPDQTRGSLC